MNSSARHSRIATVISIVAGLLLGLVVYLSWLYTFRSMIFCLIISVLSGAFGFSLMRFTALIMAWLTRVDARRLELAAAVAVASLLVIYIGFFPLPFVWMPFETENCVLAALVVFLVVNIFTFLIIRRYWVILGLLVPIVVSGAIAFLIYPFQFNACGSPFLNRIIYSALPKTPSDKKPLHFRVHHAGHTRSGFWLNMNQSLETAVVIPEDGFLRFEVGVVHPDKDLAPARLLVIAKDSTGRVYKIKEVFINRQKVAWTSHEARLSGLSQGKGVIQFQVYSMDEEHENLKPLIISNFTLFSVKDRPGGQVIVMVPDALRADVLGCYGGRDARTPVIDRLASQGVLFENAISPCSWTMPVVASIFTSRFPSQHGLIGYFWYKHDRRLLSLPELLAERGIETKASISNWTIFPAGNYDKGFNDFFMLPYSKLIWRGTEALMRESSDWIRACAGSPFFLYIHNMDPHDPYFAPEPYSFGPKITSEGSILRSSNTATVSGLRSHFGGAGKDESGGDRFQKLRSWIVFGSRIPYIYDPDFTAVDPLTGPELEELRQRYLGEVEYVDAQISLLEDALKETGLWENTLLIITSDHGEEFQDHGTLRHARHLHREIIRVPLILTGGIMKGQSKIIKSPVSLLDLYPTILEFYGIPVPPDTMGQSLWPIIEGKTGEDRMVFSEMVEIPKQECRLMSAVKGEYHLMKKAPLITAVCESEVKLYRWDTDPEEQHDLSSSEPDKVREMQQALDDFYENLPGKKRLYVTKKKQDEIQKVLKALGYMK
jgi:arylsulfatase A-like enzyme